MEDLPNLHDGTLLSLTMSWPEKTAQFVVGTATRLTVTLDIAGLTVFLLEHYEPWGPSSGVYSAELDRTHPLGQRLTLSMQSGDAIQVTAEKVDVLVRPTDEAS